MKILSKIIFIILISISTFSVNSQVSFAADNTELKTWWVNQNATNWTEKVNSPLQNIVNKETDFTIEQWWQKWIYNTLIRIARDLKNLFFIIAWIYFLIIVIKLLFTEKTEEQIWNFKKWIIRISLWIIMTQIAYYFANVLFDQEINSALANRFVTIIMEPLIKLLETSASFFFLAIMIYAFYRMITADWDEEAVKKWKMSVLYAGMWFIVIKISTALVKSIYWTIKPIGVTWVSGSVTTNIGWFANIVVKTINWMNGFVWIIVVLMIVYAWFLSLTSFWDEDKLKKTKHIITYVIVWIIILVTNYLILTFFILPDVTITNISPN